MDKTKEEFVRFIREAMGNNQSDSFAELYNFLVGCFVRADKRFVGLVSINDFDCMVEEAAAYPRKYGLAPKAIDMYPNEKARKTGRAELLKSMNLHTADHISLDEWISYCLKHIMGKINNLGKDYLAGDCTKEEFIAFIKKAVDKSNPEFKELYFFLLKCFMNADHDHDGAVKENVDGMIEQAAAAPRRHGLAPSSAEMFKNEAERQAKRLEYFKLMDVCKFGNISFDEWLKYALEHIIGKVATLK